LIHTLADAFIDLPAMKVEETGYGSGKKTMKHPNLLRLIVGESCSHDHNPGDLSHGHRQEYGHVHGHVHGYAGEAREPVHEHRHKHKQDAGSSDSGDI